MIARVASFAVLALLAALLLTSASAHAVSDQLTVTGAVHITSRLGQETIALAGTATVDRSAPYVDSGVLVMDTEIVSMNLTGDSLTGPVTVVENGSLTSSGEIRGLQASPQQYPASTYFDGYVVVTVPASPNPTIDLHNDTAIQLVGQTINNWPPYNTVYSAHPNPCIPLLPPFPAQACVTSMSFTVSSPTAVGGMTRLSAPFVSDTSSLNLGTIAAIAVGCASLFAAAAWSARRRAQSKR